MRCWRALSRHPIAFCMTTPLQLYISMAMAPLKCFSLRSFFVFYFTVVPQQSPLPDFSGEPDSAAPARTPASWQAACNTETVSQTAQLSLWLAAGVGLSGKSRCALLPISNDHVLPVQERRMPHPIQYHRTQTMTHICCNHMPRVLCANGGCKVRI